MNQYNKFLNIMYIFIYLYIKRNLQIIYFSIYSEFINIYFFISFVFKYFKYKNLINNFLFI